MIFTPHILIGAVIGAKTQSLGLIILLGIVLHIVMDKIVHYDYHVSKYINEFQETKKIKALFPLILHSIIDIIIGLSIVLFLVWQNNLFNILPFIILGIFFSLLPDIIEACILVFTKKDFIKKYLKFHFKYLHRSDKKQEEGKITFLGLMTQIIVIIVSVFLIYL